MKTRSLIFLSIFLFFAGLIFIPGIVSAHSGGTDAYGCHTCRTNCPSYGLSYGEYHCHQSKGLPQPEYPIRSHDGWTEPWPDYLSPNYGSDYSYPSRPSCPLFSTYSSLTGSCECNYGYVSDGYGGCEDGDYACHREFGYNSSYDSSTGKCGCDYGYIFNSYDQCVSKDSYCRDLLGWNAEYKILEDACGCRSGYVLNSSQTSCIDGDTYCWGLYGYNSNYQSYSKTCECDYGYEFRNGSCVEIEEEPVYNLPPSFYNTLESEVITPQPQPLVPQPISQPILPQNPPLSEPEILEKEDDVAALPDNGGITFSLAGNELLRKCGGFGCSVAKWGSINGEAEIIKQDGEWFEVMVTDNSGSVKGWFNESLVPADSQEKFLARLSTSIDTQGLGEEEAKAGFWKKLFRWLGF